jgi:glycosyltransferase involved in cell wall biosynthesis
MPEDVAIISPYPRLGERHGGHSGVASYSSQLAQSLAERGAAVTVLAAREDGHPAEGDDDGVTVRRAYGRGPGAVPAAVRAALRTGAPVVHLQHEIFLYGGPASVPGVIAGLAALRSRGRGTVVTLHQVVAPQTVDAGFTALHRVRVPVPVARRALGGMQQAIRRLADRVIVHEPSFRAAVPEAVVIPHGVQPGVAASAQERAALRERLGLDDRLAVLCFGYVAPYKGIDVALRAAELVPGDVQLIVAGGEHPRLAAAGDPYLTNLQALHGATARFTGRVADADVADWFRAADVALFAYPRPFSASGALALALAHGTPALLSAALAASAGAPDGMAVTCEPLALAGRLSMLNADRSALAHLATLSQRIGAERSWARCAASHQDVYAEVAA